MTKNRTKMQNENQIDPNLGLNFDFRLFTNPNIVIPDSPLHRNFRLFGNNYEKEETPEEGNRKEEEKNKKYIEWKWGNRYPKFFLPINWYCLYISKIFDVDIHPLKEKKVCDIEKRRESVRKISLFGDLNCLVERYMGYC